jgi:hypothetical protein
MVGKPQNGRLLALTKTERQRRWRANRRLKAKHQARLAKAAKTGIGRDHKNEHPEGFYPTPPRGTRALLTVEAFHGIIWECACGDGAISRVLVAAGLAVLSTDLVDRGYGQGGHNFLDDTTTVVDHVITNPPFGPARGLAAKFVAHALTRIRPGGKVCMLLRIGWGSAAGHQHLMAKCARKYRITPRLPMHRGGYTGKRNSPQLDCAWYVFTNEHSGPTTLELGLPWNCGAEDLPLLAAAD